MTLLLYGRKNYKGTCVEVKQDQSDLKDIKLNYRSSSLQLTSDSDSMLLFTERYWKGNLIFRTGRLNISDLGNPDEGGMPKFNNEVKSVRLTPFRMKIKYHFIYIDGDLPGDHAGIGGILTLAKQIKDMHEIVQDIWSPYFVDLEMDPILGQYNNAKYFDLSVNPDELRQLKNDSTFQFSNACMNIVLVEDVSKTGSSANVTGLAHEGELDKPVAVVEVRPSRLLFNNARAIAHEIGHTFGLDHGNNNHPNRLMTQSGQITGDITKAVQLERDEVEIVHRNLARNDSLRPLLRIE